MRPPAVLLPALLILAACGGAEAPAPAPDPEELRIRQAEALEQALLKVVEAVRPCSITVVNYQKRGDALLVAGQGSGVIVKAGGLALTNEHVVKDAVKIEVVLLDGRRFPAKVESRVAEYDIALLRILDEKGKPVQALKVASLGRSVSLKTGEWVLATGNPFMLAQSGRAVVTLGALSGFNRVVGAEGEPFFYGNAIQHDAEINPGNSGGPLWDLEGRLLGINGKISSRTSGLKTSNSGVGYTIPIDQIQNFMKDLQDGGGPVKSGDLGLDVETAKDAKDREIGARVVQVRAGSPAEANRRGQGLRKGDIVERVTIRMHSTPVHNATEFTNTLSVWPEGTKIESIEVRRDGRPLTLSEFVLGPPAAEKTGKPGPGKK